MSVPKDWEFKADGTATLFYGPNGEVIFFRALPKDQLTQASWSAMAKAYWKEKGEIMAMTATTVGGAKSSRLTHTFDMDGPYFGIAETFIHGDLAYDLQWWSPIGNEIADAATFQQVVDSFVFVR